MCSLQEFLELLKELDKKLVSVYFEKLNDDSVIEKTDFVNASGHRSLVIDLLLEDIIIDFFKEKEFPCIIEAEEKGRTVLAKNPEFLIIADPLDGSNNYRRRIPLTCYAIAIAKLEKNNAFFNDTMIASCRSFHSNEFYYALKGKGAFDEKDNPINPSKEVKLERAMVAFDLDRAYRNREDVVSTVFKVLKHCRGTRRFGANILDIMYVASGKIEAMIDIREKFSAVHTPALFICEESGAKIKSFYDTKFNPILKANENINFVLCGNQKLMDVVMKKMKGND